MFAIFIKEYAMDENLTELLRAWATRENIRPIDFSRTTGYSYQHAHNLLNGAGKATDETLGRIAMTYGAQAVSSILGSQGEAEAA
jgi:hypothetical protein